MNIQVEIRSKRRKLSGIALEFPSYDIVDVTSAGVQPWIQFSPFYPHGSIPVPFSPGVFSQSVEGIWQGLKVFTEEDIDPSKFAIRSMRNLKRSSKTRGNILGHRKGMTRNEILPYTIARQVIYIPSYKNVLERLQSTLILRLLEKAQSAGLVLLDYETNDDVQNIKTPLSHASLIRHAIQELANSGRS